ncbi:MAG TPA: S9 family peptidase [Methylobacter sp.]|jgi:dipeptidyl aminopeptidase/acylaminoacyl peptidase
MHFISLLLLALNLIACQPKLSNSNQEFKTELKSGELPVEAFAALPAFVQMSWSSDGKTVAYLQNSNGKTALITSNLNGENQKVLIASDNLKSSIKNYEWIGNDRLLIRLNYFEEYGGIMFIETRLFAINKDGTQSNGELVRFNRNENFSQIQDNFTVIDGDDRKVFIELDKTNRRAPDVYTLDVYDGHLEKVVSNPHYVRGWIYDKQGGVRVGIGIDGNQKRIIYRMNPNDDWKVLAEYRGAETGIVPLGFGEEADELYISAPDNGRKAVYKINLKNPQQRKLVFASPKYDIEGKLIYSTNKKQVIGINSHGMQYLWDTGAIERQKEIAKLLPNNVIHIMSSRDQTHLFAASGPKSAPAYYVFDEAKKSVYPVAEIYPQLKPEYLNETKPLEIEARDGLRLEAYLTQPKQNIQHAAPTIIFPHGGPSDRDTNRFDYWTQFFTNRGWNVLRLNFRGSSGYGEEFSKSGFKRWGLEMQDDITDGVNWLVKNRIADPGKICIVGGSYGGYAALMGIIKTPDLYRCAVSFAPVTDLLDLIDEKTNRYIQDAELAEEIMEKKIGHWWSNRDRLKQTSPAYLAASVRKPVLIAHGAEDMTVSVEQSRKLVTELKNIGFSQYEYLELENADHYLSREQDRLDFFRTMDKFLKNYQ